MSRLDNYLLETIKKFEYDDILKDKNVRIGCEFEFYQTSLKDIYGDNDKSEDWSDYYYFMKEIVKYKEELKEYKEQLKEFLYYKDEYENWEIYKEGPEPNFVDEPDFEPEPPEIPEYVYKNDSKTNIDAYLDNYFIPTPDEYDNENDSDRQQKIINQIEDEVNELIKNTDDWEFKTDGTLDTHGIEHTGIEIATSPMTLEEFLDVVPKIFNYIDYTDNTCGFHVSISFKGIDLSKDFDSFKIALFMEEEYVYRYFKSRKGNQYALSVFDDIVSQGSFKPDLFKQVIDKKKVDRNITIQHYMGINIENIAEKDGSSRVEFRYLGDKDYHKKWNKVKDIIIRYIYFMKLACDLNYKRKEYLVKIQRVLNKIEYVRLKSFRDKLKSIIDSSDATATFIDWKLKEIYRIVSKSIMDKNTPSYNYQYLINKYFGDFDSNIFNYDNDLKRKYLEKGYRQVVRDLNTLKSMIKLTSREESLITDYVLGV